jgi:hypothetical protein
MKRHVMLCGLWMLLAAGVCYADEKAAPATPHPALEKLSKLVGTWGAADKDDKPTDEVVSVIRLTAGGTAIHETLFPGQPHEMVSIYTIDGDDLVMTHYCVLGNQPRMKADPKSPENQIRFVFAGGSNLDPKKDKHMHGATITIIDNDHVQVEGEGWEDGKPMHDMCGTLKLIRKK